MTEPIDHTTLSEALKKISDMATLVLPGDVEMICILRVPHLPGRSFIIHTTNSNDPAGLAEHWHALFRNEAPSISREKARYVSDPTKKGGN